MSPSHRPRSQVRPLQYTPASPAEQVVREKYILYSVRATSLAKWGRTQFTTPEQCKSEHNRVFKVFTNYSHKYPSVLPSWKDVEGKREFWYKCEALCQNWPTTIEECLLQYFACHSAALCLMERTLHPDDCEKVSRIRASCKPEIARQLQDVLKNTVCEKRVVDDGQLLQWIDHSITVREHGRPVQYVVLDVVTSVRNGMIFVLEDEAKGVKEVSKEVFEGMLQNLLS